MAMENNYNFDHLVGVEGELAKTHIESSHQHLKVHVLHKDAMVTMDYNPMRVRIFVDDNNKVVRSPRTG